MQIPWGPSRAATITTAFAIVVFALSLLAPAAHVDMMGDIPGLYAFVLVFVLATQKPYAILVILANVWASSAFWVARSRSLALLIMGTLLSLASVACVFYMRRASPFDELREFYPGYWLWFAAHAIMALGLAIATIERVVR